MSEGDSIPSSDNNTGTGNNTINPANTAPSLTKESDSPDINTHGYFIPLVVMIVLGVSIVAAFYSKEFNTLIAGVAPSDREHGHVNVKQKLLATTGTSDESEDRTKSGVITGAAIVANASDEKTANITEAAVDDSTLTTTDTTSSETVATNASSAEFRIVAAQDKPASHTDKQNRGTYPHEPPMGYWMPREHQQAYNNMMEQRRRSYEEAMQARREHMIKMHEYRTAVLMRIEQDRQHMYKRMQDIEHENRRRQDELMNSLEREEKSSMNRPI